MNSLLRALGAALCACAFTAAPALAEQPDHGKPPFDIRDRQHQAAPVPDTAAQVAGRAHLGDRLGDQGVLDYDAQTNTPRVVAKLDGFLTGPSSAAPADIAIGYVRSHLSAFGLTNEAVDSLHVVRNYSDESGTTHLVWAQVLDGIKAFDNDLHANVTKDGRLINISGSPIADVATRTTDPSLSASAALRVALDDADVNGLAPKASAHGTADDLTTFTGGHNARLVLFTERPGDVHLAWEITANAASDEIYDYVVDARTGQLLYRQNDVNFASATLNVWEYAPNIDSLGGGVPAKSGDQQVHGTLFGGDQIQVNDGTALNGPYAHTYADVNDDNSPAAGSIPSGDDIPATSGTNWGTSFTHFNDGAFFPNCSATFPQCSWDSSTSTSWSTNISQNAAQVYFFVNNFHDWLAKSNVGFTAASGNFEAAGGDAVQAQIDDGANKASGLPDQDHSSNANMSTGADGSPPRMQMYLFPGTSQAPDANGGDDASVIYHEYSHGLSNRLVTGGTGGPALRSFHARAMGEGWSDYYAMDYLFAQNLDSGDTAAPGEVNIGFYMKGGEVNSDLRSEPIDCPVVNSNNGSCTGGNTGHAGGYTLADMGHVINQAEFHADGEIWVQTLWDVRTALGADNARKVITDGMRLSPPDPSMIDMRNAILQADQVDFGGAHLTQLWATFAARGFGVGASVTSGADTAPHADFTTPANNGVTVTGKVTDSVTGAAVGGAYVYFDGNAAPGDYATTADGAGNYSLSTVQPATFAHVLVSAPGYGHLDQPNVAVGAGPVNFAIQKNFAAAAGGAKVTAFTAPDFSGSGCGPGGFIDGALTSGWGSNSPQNTSNPVQGQPAVPAGPRAITIALPVQTDVTGISVDPTATCGDADSSSTGQFTIETSTDGVNFTQAASSAFGAANLRKLNGVVGAVNGVRAVRFTMVTPQSQKTAGGDGSGGQDTGVAFMDSSEIEVYGKATPPPPPPPPPPPADKTAPTAKFALVKKQHIKTIVKSGLKFSLTCNEACQGTLAGTIDSKTAKKLKLLKKKSKAKTFKVCTAKVSLKAGKRTIVCKFAKKPAKALKKLKSVKITVSGTLTDAAKNKRKVKTVATVKK